VKPTILSCHKTEIAASLAPFPLRKDEITRFHQTSGFHIPYSPYIPFP